MDLPFELHIALRYLLAKRKQAFISVIKPDTGIRKWNNTFSAPVTKCTLSILKKPFPFFTMQ